MKGLRRRLINFQVDLPSFIFFFSSPPRRAARDRGIRAAHVYPYKGEAGRGREERYK